jgi:hypothetical protein
MWDFVMDRSGAGAGFLQELRFPLPIYILSASPQSSSVSPEAGTISQEWPQCQQPHKPEKKNLENMFRIIPRLKVKMNNEQRPFPSSSVQLQKNRTLNNRNYDKRNTSTINSQNVLYN